MSNTIYIGIDPGMSGGIAWIINDNGSMKGGAIKMPSTETDINNLLYELKHKGENVFCVLEQVHSFPGQGVASSFKFGKGYGVLRGVLVANKIPFADISPQKWQRSLNLLRTNKEESNTSHKNRIKGRAQQQFPETKVTLATSDALMIAYYCKQQNY